MNPISPEERVVLVDESDAEVGTLEKQRAHVEGRLHRALSVFVFNENGDVVKKPVIIGVVRKGELVTAR